MQTDEFLFEEEDLRTTLAAIINRDSPKWIRLGAAILKNREDAEDVLSEAVRRMLKRGQSFSSQEHMRMYMCRVVNNTAVEFYKRRKRERRQYAPILENITQKPAAEQSDSFRPDLIMEEEERYAEHQDRLRILRSGLEELPAHQYEAIRLTVLNNCGMTHRDIESASGIPRTTLRFRYVQGLRALRKYMTRELNRKNRDRPGKR